ncbi:MAG: regulatory protein RecX [Sutterella sp.]|nr:regulatory protein RecX [Sutterella sp.]
MGRYEDEVGGGALFVWGESGLETEKASPSEIPSQLPPAEDAAAEQQLSFHADISPHEQRTSDIQNEGSLFPDEERSLITRERPRRSFRRQRHQFSSDEDFCNDPDELIRRVEDRKKERRAGDGPSLFMRAAGALARRDYSRKDLSRKLRRGLRDGETPEEADAVLERLENAGYLSDERFAENRARVRSHSLGNARIRRELSMSGVSRENIDRAMEQIEEPEEIRALRVWKRRFAELPADRRERDKQVRYLLYRGFSMGSVNKVLRGEVYEPEDEEAF